MTVWSEWFLLLSAIAGNALPCAPFGDNRNRGGQTCSVLWSAAEQPGVPSTVEDDGKETTRTWDGLQKSARNENRPIAIAAQP